MSLNKIRADLNRPQALAERNEVWSGVVVIEDMSEERLRLLRDAPAPDGWTTGKVAPVFTIRVIAVSRNEWTGRSTSRRSGGQHMPCEAYGLVDIGTVAIDPQVSLPLILFLHARATSKPGLARP